MQPQDCEHEDKGCLHQEHKDPPRLLPQQGVEGDGEGGEKFGPSWQYRPLLNTFKTYMKNHQLEETIF